MMNYFKVFKFLISNNTLDLPKQKCNVAGNGYSGREIQGLLCLPGLQFRIPPVSRCLSLFNVVFIQIQLSVKGRSLVQRSPTDSMFVMECDQLQQ